METDLPMEVDTQAREDRENLPFVEKFRPDSLSEIISHTEIISTSKPPHPQSRNSLMRRSYRICYSTVLPVLARLLPSLQWPKRCSVNLIETTFSS